MRRMYDKDEIADIAGGGGIGELKSIDFPYGQETVTYDTTDGVTIAATARLTHVDSNDTTDVPTTLSVPLIASTGITMDADTAGEKVNIKVDNHVAYMPNIEPTGTRMPMFNAGQWTSSNVSRTADSYSIARRGDNGVLEVGTPTAAAHAATKAYVDTAVAGAGGGSNTTLICTNDNFPAYTYTFPADKAVKIEYMLKAQGITDQATLSVVLNGATSKTIYSTVVAAGADEMITGTLYYFNGNNSNYPTSGGANTAAGPAIISSCTSATGTEMFHVSGMDYTSVTFTAGVTGPTGSKVFGTILITPLT